MEEKSNTTRANERKRLRVLLLAYACEPNCGSEPGTGWNMAFALAKHHDVTVVTRANNQPAIEKFLGSPAKAQPTFLYIDPPTWALRLKKQRILPIQVFYALWQWSVARALKTKPPSSFNIIHQLTFNSFEVPPLVFLGSDSTNVWGPMGGGQTVPFRLLPAFGAIGGLKEGLRNVRVHASAINPLFRKVLRKSSLILFANRETAKVVKGNVDDNLQFMIDVGVDVNEFTPALKEAPSRKVTILFAGRLEHRKGALLLLKGFERVLRRHQNVELRLIGDGPLRQRLMAYAQKSKIDDKAIFPGLISHAEMRREMAATDIFAFPSLRDTSGAVVLEAMATALPVVCFDHQGAALMVADGCGLRVPAQSMETAVEGFANAICNLIENPVLISEMGNAARAHVVKNYHWDSKAVRMDQYYRSLVAPEHNPVD